MSNFLSKLFSKNKNATPKPINGDLCHEILAANMTPALSYNKALNYESWKNDIKEKLIELVGIKNIEANACPIKIEIESDIQKKDYRIVRFTFESEVGATVPCYLLIPNTGKKSYPVAITLQGHSTGFHLSINEAKYPRDKVCLPRCAFAVQAVKNGFAALAIEQRAMGERKASGEKRKNSHMCEFGSLTALLLGRTTLGERMWDVSRAIDCLAGFDQCDTDRILITGNSGGGTMSYYAACYDERIKLSVPSCAFCGYKSSILDIYHCSCNYIPNAYRYFDMADLACLIAPRQIIVVAGKEDRIFPIEGVREAYDKLKSIYAAADAENNCRLVETPKGHWWCDDIVWEAIREKTKQIF